MRKRIRPSTFSTADKHLYTINTTSGDRTDTIFTATYPVDIIRITCKLMINELESAATEISEGIWGIVMAPDGTTINAANDTDTGVTYEPQSHWLSGAPWCMAYNGTGDGPSPHVYQVVTYEPKEGDSIVGLNTGDRIAFVTGDNGSYVSMTGFVKMEFAS